MTCPDHHVVYLSPALADAAIRLHLIALPECGGMVPFACDDHWHIGHRSKRIGQACKNNPNHNAARRRITNRRLT